MLYIEGTSALSCPMLNVNTLNADIILSIIDFFFDDTHSLCQCSLVNKQWLLLARRQLFNDLTIKLCANPLGHGRCRQCISHFSLLVASRRCTIPSAIRTLRLNGEEREKNWSSMWTLVGNPGGMERPAVIRALMNHFQSVERLELIDLDWFDPPWSSSRTVVRCLSSVKSLTLDHVGFYGGPRALVWMLSKMPNLEVLSTGELHWPEQSGFPNNTPGLLVFAFNAADCCPIFWVPLYKLIKGSLKVTEMMKPPTSRFSLQKPLRTLAVYIRYRTVDDPCLHWLLTQTQKLSSVTTLEVSTRFTQEEGIIFQSLLDCVDSLHHLTIHDDFWDNNDVATPTLNNHQALESLKIYSSLFNPPQTWAVRLNNMLHTLSSSRFTVIQLTINTSAQSFFTLFGPQNKSSEVSIIDDYLGCSIATLRQLRISVGLPYAGDGVRTELERSLDEEAMRRLAKVAFGKCELKGILRLKVRRYSEAADFLEGED
jgi:hypothetical protein